MPAVELPERENGALARTLVCSLNNETGTTCLSRGAGHLARPVLKGERRSDGSDLPDITLSAGFHLHRRGGITARAGLRREKTEWSQPRS